MFMDIQLNKKDLAFLVLLGTFCLFLFWDIIVEGLLLSGTDFIAFYLGMKKFLYDEILTHYSIPFWNPYIFGGMPFCAHFESTIFYPLDILFWIMPADKAYGYTMFIHIVLAGIFMYILCRSFCIRRAGSFVAAAVFACNGFVMAILYMGQMCPVQSYIWLPAIIYVLNQAIMSKTPYFLATTAGVIWGVQILAGAPQDAFYTFLASVLFVACSIKRDLKTGGYGIKLLAIPFLMFVIASGLAAIQLVPAFELIGESVRAGLDRYEMVTMGSYPLEGITTTVMPNFFGSYADKSFWVSNVPWSVPQQNLYVGILTVILLFFISYRNPDNRKIKIFAGSLALIAFVLALGRHTPVYKLAYLLPGFDRFRAPSKIIVLWVFAMALLAGIGMDDLFRHGKERLFKRAGFLLCFVIVLVAINGVFHFDGSMTLRFFAPFVPEEAIPEKMIEAASIIRQEFHRFTLFSGIILLLILLWMRGFVKPKLAAALLCVILLFDLSRVNGQAVQHNDSLYQYMEQTKHDLDATIGQDRSVYRVGAYGSNVGPNLEMYLGYQTVGGFTALFLHRYYEYVNQYCTTSIPEGWEWFSYAEGNSKLMDLLNVKYEVSYLTREYGLRNTYLPRAFIVPDHKILKKEEVLDYMIRPDFDPRQSVLFEEGDQLADLLEPSSVGVKEVGRAAITSYRPDEIVLVTDLPEAGFLFLSEIYYPGWKVFVGEKEKRIIRGNYLFRVVELPKGHHVVRFVFDPLSIKVGLGITIFSLFIFVGAVAHHLGKRSGFW